MNSDFNLRLARPGSMATGGTVAILLVAISLVVIGWLPLLNAVLLLPFLAGLYGLAIIPDARRLLLVAVLIPTFLIGFFMAIYRPAGFDYPLVWNPGPLYENGSPFKLYVNLSKAIGGYLVILWLWHGLRSFETNQAGARAVWECWTLPIAGAGSIFLAASAFFGVGWEPKWPDGILHFFCVNLLVTVVAEEAFFRLLLQNQVERFFKSKVLGICMAVAISSLLFALAHSGAKGAAFFLFLFAGVVYATVYARTKSLSASIATHFGVNILHITLLEYPLQ